MAKNKEWEKEMMKWSKQNLINLLEKVISEGKQQQTSDGGLNIPVVRVFCPKCNEPYITYTEHEYYQCNSCDHEWI